jgi:hypothetical protein
MHLPAFVSLLQVDSPMAEDKKLVAVISPWEKLSELVKKQFRLESLPTEKKVMAWREDLQDEQSLLEELKKLGVKEVELRQRHVVTRWQDTE